MNERILPSSNRLGQCKICFTYGPYTKHHIIPREYLPKRASGKQVKLCARCHVKVHQVFTNEQLSKMPWVETAEAIRKLIPFVSVTKQTQPYENKKRNTEHH